MRRDRLEASSARTDRSMVMRHRLAAVLNCVLVDIMTWPRFFQYSSIAGLNSRLQGSVCTQGSDTRSPYLHRDRLQGSLPPLDPAYCNHQGEVFVGLMISAVDASGIPSLPDVIPSHLT